MDAKIPEIVVLACGKGGCCPTVEVTGEKIILHDTDDGRDSHIALSIESAKVLRDVLNRKLEK